VQLDLIGFDAIGSAQMGAGSKKGAETLGGFPREGSSALDFDDLRK
jgi:hypothetical protein